MTASVHLTPFKKRDVSYLGLHEVSGARLKVYCISGEPSGIPATGALQAASLEQAQRYLNAPSPPCDAGGFDWSQLRAHNVGSLIIHPGREAVFLLLSLWVGENMLRHHVWVAQANDGVVFESLGPTDVAMCVWEMAVLQHERSAWLRHMLTPEGVGDVAGYLGDVFEGQV